MRRRPVGAIRIGRRPPARIDRRFIRGHAVRVAYDHALLEPARLRAARRKTNQQQPAEQISETL